MHLAPYTLKIEDYKDGELVGGLERVGGSTRPAGYYEPQKTAIILQKLGTKKVVLNYPAVANGKSIKVLLTRQFEFS